MTYWDRFLTLRQPDPIAPSSTSWTAACPQCRRDAEWFSVATMTRTKKTIACDVCGIESWVEGQRP